MADLKVFVSSTCYDLSIIREQLKKFIEQMGYTSILSEYSDVLYDPREHTHTSCIQEVNNIDMLVLIIGSRFGGTSVPESLTKLNFEKLKELSTKPELLEDEKNISITQAEVLKAIEIEIPIYVFVEDKVYHEHFVYTQNKDFVDIDKMTFPSIDKQASAKYIFNFIDFLSHRLNNNNIMTYSKVAEIETQLKKQWSGYFQKLLKEQATSDYENKNYVSLSDQISEIKVALISTISSDEAKVIARGTLEFKKLIETLTSLNITKRNILDSKVGFLELLLSVDIQSILEINNQRHMRNTFIFIKNDKKIIVSRVSINFLLDLVNTWELFAKTKQKHKEAICDTLIDTTAYNRGIRLFTQRNESLKEFLKANYNSEKRADMKKMIIEVEDLFKK